jgi:RNA polymerase sigma-70 factor, ECF subfamily
VAARLEEIVRMEHGRLLGALLARCRDFERCEEALQDALVEGLALWRAQGEPRNPAAWLLIAARRRLIDRLRRERLSRQTLEQLGTELEEGAESAPADALDDDRLRLFFTCCHPALAPEAQVALLLNAVCGLEAPDIARAFLLRDEALAQRLVRAKRKVREAGIPFRVPPPELLPVRLPGVLSAIYLVYNEGHVAARGSGLVRADLCSEALRLAGLVTTLLEHEPEPRGLFALLLLHESRRAARVDAHGALVPLEDQDRGRWDREAIGDAVGHLERALRAKRVGPYQLQAAIAAVHAEARTAADTDWRQIALLYGELLHHEPSPVVALNRAVAVAMSEGPERGLDELKPIEQAGELSAYPYLQAVKADLLRRAGRPREARACYARALGLTRNAAERRYLERRLAECG